MPNKEKIINHLTKPDNIIIYACAVIYIFFTLQDHGLKNGLFIIAKICFLLVAVYAVFETFFAIKTRTLNINFIQAASYFYLLVFSFYWIYNYGVSYKVFILLLFIIFFGLFLASITLFINTDTYNKLGRWENGIFRKIGNFFKNKT